MKKVIFSLAIMLFIMGCSDKKEANKENFKESLNKYYAKKCILVVMDKTISIDATQKAKGKIFMGKYLPTDMEKYNYFTKLGFYTASKKVEKRKLMFSNKYKNVDIVVFKLTKKGEKYFYSRSLRMGGKMTGFCAGNFSVEKIENFSKPSQAFGYTLSTINFKANIINKADFTKSDEFYKIFPHTFKRIPNKRQVALTENGWIAENI